MTEHRYILEPYKGMSTRYRCPSCNKGKTLSLYIDKETKKHLAPSVGRCNRESKCGYHYPPKQYFQDNNILSDIPRPKTYTKTKAVMPQQKLVSFIPVEQFKQSLNHHIENNFIKFLITLFGAEVTNELISKYFIGTSKHWEGATVFWQIDIYGKIRTGKIMLYDFATGKRKKDADKVFISWVHTTLKIENFNLKQCFFGEHLLNSPENQNKPVAIVESEKTAVIANGYLPQFIWLAVGSLTNLNAEKCYVLKGRDVTLFPDLNGFEKWNNKIKELSHLARFNISDLLERKATEDERKQGLDLADYLIRFDYSAFEQATQPEQKQPEVKEVQEFYTVEKTNNCEITVIKHEKSNPENWEQEIKELENYFGALILPTLPVKLKPHEEIKDVSKMIIGHLAYVKANNGNRTYLPYLNRLQELKQYLITNLN